MVVEQELPKHYREYFDIVTSRANHKPKDFN